MRLDPNRSFVSPEPALFIDAGLALGAHRFRLEVVGSSGRRSRPAAVVVFIVLATAAPDARRSGHAALEAPITDGGG